MSPSSPLRLTAATLTAIAVGRALRTFNVGPRLVRRLTQSRDPARAGVVLERFARGLVLEGLPRLAGASRLPSPDAAGPPPSARRSAAFVVAFGAVTMLGASVNARSPEVQATCPRIRSLRESWTNQAVNAGSWTLYLVTYERMFRRTLRAVTRQHLPAAPAEVAAVVIYALDHAPVSRTEFLGSMVMGPLLSAAARWTGSTRPLVIGHAIMAISNDIFAARAREL